MRIRCRAALLLPLLSAALLAPAGAQEAPAQDPSPDLVVRNWLALDPVDGRARAPFNPNNPFLRYLLDRDASPPVSGELVKGTAGEAAWREVEATEDGTVEDGTGAWFAGEVTSAAEGVFLAHLDRASTLFVNGAGFTGDLYGMGTGPVPVALRKGANRLFVAGPRGPWSLRFERWTEGRSPVLPMDATLPDAVEGDEPGAGRGSVRILNPSTEWRPTPWIAVSGFGPEGPPPPPGWPSPLLAPLWVGKAEVDLGPWGLRGPVSGTRVGFSILAASPSGTDPARTAFTLPIRRPGAARRVTFRSRIDGSVQYYAVLDPAVPAPPTVPVSTVLTVHGAGVEALDQARAYSPRDDFRIVAPTNRRPFGFDWQDWGRTDGYEVLEHALSTLGGDPHRVFLTGHSMGGHGAWHLAANDPDRWAAIAPSAGWCSFDTYGGGPRPESELSHLWRAADGGSRTEDLITNLVPLPTFVLHGTKDDNVPLSEAKDMIARLEKAGGHPLHHFEEGAGHWWDGDAAAGADCVDWPGIFDLFRRSRAAEAPEEIDFTSVDPGMDALHHWVMVFRPLLYGRPLRVRGRRTGGRAVLVTENVGSLSLLPLPGETLREVSLDGQVLRVEEGIDGWHREGVLWVPGLDIEPGMKTPERSGPFKRAFGNRFVLVVGTKDGESGNREMLELARFHASQWWYRANGNAPVVRDIDLLARPREFARRNLILYGNEETNAAWKACFPADGPVRVRRGEIAVGDRRWKGDDLGALLVGPRAGEEDALVAAFASTGDRGTRVGYGLLPFTSGVGYPDWAVFGAGFLASGDGGVLGAGWLDHLWALQSEGSFLRPPEEEKKR